eukprot:GHVR01096161.1.p1 GENE.GHVR01096161.1~~GHVR01096161.1.p1  ORF type:complete len:119 (-),score=90.62 GHVR01096161.1:54-362(-)
MKETDENTHTHTMHNSNLSGRNYSPIVPIGSSDRYDDRDIETGDRDSLQRQLNINTTQVVDKDEERFYTHTHTLQHTHTLPHTHTSVSGNMLHTHTHTHTHN